MNEKNLILVGGGGHCRSVIEAAESAGYTIAAILDTPENVGREILGHPVTGTDEDMQRYVDRGLFLITVGHIKDASVRIRLHEKVVSAGGRLATVVASTARVSPYARVGEGSVVLHFALVNAGAAVGRGCIVNSFADIEHDACVEDYCHISTGVLVNGGCRVGAASFIGSQSVLAQGVSVASGCVVGAGSLVRKSMTRRGIYSGNPAVLKIKLEETDGEK